MESILYAVVAAALAVAITVRWTVVAQRKEAPDVSPLAEIRDWMRSVDVDLHDHAVRMGALEADHEDVRAAVAHGIEDIERVDNRIKATIRRTTKQLEEAGVESPALNAEAEHFRVVDGGGGSESGLPTVPEIVEDVQSSIPGVSAAELAKVRGGYSV